MHRHLSLISLIVLAQPILLAQSNADCWAAKEICKKQTYHIDKTGGEGEDPNEANFVACFMNGENYGQAEENSTWIRFEIEKSGSLTFFITPHKEDDDLDFVVYRLPASGDCKQKQIVRCMAAGDSENNFRVSPCMGKTGLREGESDASEDAGCADAGDNTWLAPLKVEKGEKYVILVSNVSSRGPGFSISFGGSAKLPCDEDPPKKTPVVDKPKPRPTNPTRTSVAEKPQVTEKPIAKPESIGGRDVVLKESLTVKARTIKLKIWDSQVEDGDVISIYLGDKKVVDNLYLRSKQQEFEIELPPGTEHYLTVYAEDFGKAEPNTARVLISDGVREQTIDLVAERKKQQSVKIILE
ncbi:MAG: hypothetical protein ACKVU2_14700 [Saprospiraceae bacterium]